LFSPSSVLCCFLRGWSVNIGNIFAFFSSSSFVAFLVVMVLFVVFELAFTKETSSNAYEFTGTRGKTKNFFVFSPPSSRSESVFDVVVISQ